MRTTDLAKARLGSLKGSHKSSSSQTYSGLEPLGSGRSVFEASHSPVRETTGMFGNGDPLSSTPLIFYPRRAIPDARVGTTENQKQYTHITDWKLFAVRLPRRLHSFSDANRSPFSIKVWQILQVPELFPSNLLLMASF